MHKEHKEKVFHFLLMAAATAVLLVVARMASVIVAPMLMALFLTIILLVPLRWLQSKGFSKFISLVIVIFCTAILFLGIARLVIVSLNDFLHHFPSYKAKIIKKVESLDGKLADLGFTLGNRTMETENSHETPGETPPALPPSETPLPQQPSDEHSRVPDPPPVVTVEESTVTEESTAETLDPSGEEGGNEDVTPSSDEPLEEEELNIVYDRTFFPTIREKQNAPIELNTESVMYWVGKAVVELRNLAASSFLIMIITLFMISEATRFPEKIDWALGKTGPISNTQLHNIASEIRRYLFIKSISCLLSSVAATIVYLWFGVPGAWFWGLVAFFLYFIPNIGGVIAAIIPGLLIFMALDVEGLLLYAVCLVSIECTLGYGIEPKMLGHGLGISTVVIFLSLLTWGWILGPVGLFLAAPLTIMVKIILQSFEETEWIAILLGDKYQPPARSIIDDSRR
ncbi:MAG: AI-2E family transporter [Planctomycetaceae bacterium]|nr:AI-2E family transporter [Planctomycetaceae bacterium]